MSLEKYRKEWITKILSGVGTKRQCQLTKAQMRTFITIRALAASPLFIGGDLPTMDEYALSLLTNPEMLVCNQNGHMGTLVGSYEGVEVWITQVPATKMEGWFDVFNRTQAKKTVKIIKKAGALAINANKSYDMIKSDHSFRLLFVWKDKTISLQKRPVKMEILPDDVLFVKYQEL